jgi:hypothetical protein
VQSKQDYDWAENSARPETDRALSAVPDSPASPLCHVLRTLPQREDNNQQLLADLAFFVGVMLAAGGAELFDFKFLRHGALVLGGYVVGASARSTGQLDEISHQSAPQVESTAVIRWVTGKSRRVLRNEEQKT